MQTIGFIEEKDSKIIREEFILDKTRSANLQIEGLEKKKIIEYLEHSNSIFAITLGLFDGATYIGPYMILTDGIWIWPSHFSYYLLKNDFLNINSDFYFYLKNKKFKSSKLSENEIKKAKFFLEKELLNIGHNG
jgi:hypothetical protein